jgi:integrase/recombinase XerD
MEKKTRHRNGGLRKVCGCKRRQWPKCEHSWYLNYKPRGGPSYRLSLDAYAGKHIASKTEAAKIANSIKAAIGAGTFKTRREAAVDAAQQPASTPDVVTLKAFGQTFLERAGQDTANNRACLSRLTAFALSGGGTLGDKLLGAITEDDVEAFVAHLRREGRAASTVNKYVQLVKALFRWAVRKKYLSQNPIAETDALKREKMAQRHRRLAPDVVNPKTEKLERAGEERALLAVAGAHLQRLIIGALETGLRLGELLRLQWSDVNLAGRRLTVPAEKTKTRTERVLPISARLAGVLEMAQAALVASLPDMANERERGEHVARCFVFGDGVGQRVRCVRKAWDTAVLKAHGHKPVWFGSNTLAAESRTALRAIDLHFHDLRHEAGSRFHEAGWPLHHVQHLLGHKSLEQTTTYLNVTLTGLEESMRRFDESVARCKPVAKMEAVERAPLCNLPAEPAPHHQVN